MIACVVLSEPVCLFNPCYNGQCQADGYGDPICICNVGYTGTLCESKSSPVQFYLDFRPRVS